jgi:hypothetical protein
MRILINHLQIISTTTIFIIRGTLIAAQQLETRSSSIATKANEDNQLIARYMDGIPLVAVNFWNIDLHSIFHFLGERLEIGIYTVASTITHMRIFQMYFKD